MFIRNALRNEYSAIIRGFESPKGEIPLNKVTNNCDNYRSYYV
jgi:hypothetical protein